MKTVSYERVEQDLNRSRSESHLQWILWVTEWVRCARQLGFNEELHLKEIHLNIHHENQRFT
jgi:hypothetical protein